MFGLLAELTGGLAFEVVGLFAVEAVVGLVLEIGLELLTDEVFGLFKTELVAGLLLNELVVGLFTGELVLKVGLLLANALRLDAEFWSFPDKEYPSRFTPV